jgi:hypothetical protein
VKAVEMPETRKNLLLQWALSSWPAFLIGLAIAAFIVWTGFLGWLIIEAILLMF